MGIGIFNVKSSWVDNLQEAPKIFLLSVWSDREGGKRNLLEKPEVLLHYYNYNIIVNYIIYIY